MKSFLLAVKGFSIAGRYIGAAFLMSVVIVMCANVAYRALGGIIPGTFDLVELLIVPAVGFALILVEYERQHTIVDMVTLHLKPRLRSALETFMSIVSLLYWTALCWFSLMMLLKKMATGEHTQLLHLSVTPFRAIWTFTLLGVCIAIIRNLAVKWTSSGEKE
jgi:TRAP-type C4-dicarboxylate transport system permease small subunit